MKNKIPNTQSTKFQLTGKEMFKNFKENYPWLLRTYFKDKFNQIDYSPLSVQPFDEKIYANYFRVLRQLYIAVWKQKFVDFLNFTKNEKVCSGIKQVIDKNSGIISGHSYIVISKDKEILKNIMTLIMFEQTNNTLDLMPQCNYFNFIELASELSLFKRQFRKDDDRMQPWENVKGDIYYDCISLPVGYVFPTEDTERQAYVQINDRMLHLMNDYRTPKGVVIVSPKPMPFFAERIEDGVDKLHILDLRNLPLDNEETVEME